MSEGKAGHLRTSWAQRPSTGPLSAWPPVYPVLSSAGQQLRRSRSDHPEQAVGSCGQAEEGTRNLTHQRSVCQDWQQTRLSRENRGKWVVRGWQPGRHGRTGREERGSRGARGPEEWGVIILGNPQELQKILGSGHGLGLRPRRLSFPKRLW